MEGLATLRELGYSKRDAARALHQADGDMDRAYGVRGSRRYCKNTHCFSIRHERGYAITITCSHNQSHEATLASRRV